MSEKLGWLVKYKSEAPLVMVTIPDDEETEDELWEEGGERRRLGGGSLAGDGVGDGVRVDEEVDTEEDEDAVRMGDPTVGRLDWNVWVVEMRFEVRTGEEMGEERSGSIEESLKEEEDEDDDDDKL